MPVQIVDLEANPIQIAGCDEQINQLRQAIFMAGRAVLKDEMMQEISKEGKLKSNNDFVKLLMAISGKYIRLEQSVFEAMNSLDDEEIAQEEVNPANRTGH